ncbi:MAG TPA: chromosome segregation protein SMC [Terriglobales bacterium]|nr:chromosome segregation protein SMC [Terriglobales bacterium]
MLKLKKLQILGFKSFCDRTELKFHGEGIAAIVGPNGCGKSNISDAISWVLGEQSAKSLRGARMDDVIFAGTRERKPTGMAEVSLTLIDPVVYDGADANAEMEIEIRDEMPLGGADQDDWDEATVRAQATAEAERYTEEVRPLDPVEVEVPAADAAGDAKATPGTGDEASLVSAEADGPIAEGESPGPQVVLKIRRRTLKRPELRMGEIRVTRRLFRSGESEYLLNGKICRLRDIQELFMGTGLGPESYAIIEQGRIGQILSSKPHDRRAIIEEAAGITKFKTKKRLAEARLEQAKLNLSRVNDIFEEVTRQMNSLKRQAAKAERYARVRDELRERLRLVLASKFSAMSGEAAALNASVAEATEQIGLRTGEVQQREEEHRACTQRGYGLEEQSRITAEGLAAAAREIDRCSSTRIHNEERCAELDLRAVTVTAQLEQSKVQHTGLVGERDFKQSELENAAAEAARAQQHSQLLQAGAADAAGRLNEVEAQQEARRSDLMRAVASASEVRNQITQAQEQAAALGRESKRLEQEMAAAQQEIEAFGGRRGQISLEFESASQRVNALLDQIAWTRQYLQERRIEETNAKRRLDQLRAEYASALGKRASLEAVIAEHGYSTDSVRRLFRSGALQGGMAPAGVLADFLEVDQQYEHVVEDFLRDELNYIVVKSWDAADHGLQSLRTDVDGRATFLVHPNDSQARFSFAVDESHRHQPAREEILPITRCIRVLDGFGKSLEVILPKLRDGYIVQDAAAARDLALDSPDSFFLAPTGECFHNVTVTGGKQRSEGPLSMKRELRDVSRLVGDLESALREQEAKVAGLTREIAELVVRLDRLEAEKHDADHDALSSGHTLKQLEQEIGRATSRTETYIRELDHLRTERDALLGRAAEQEAALASTDQRKQELESAMALAQEQLGGLRAARDAAGQSAAEMLAQLAAAEERRKAATATLQRMEAMLTEAQNRNAEFERQIEAACAEKLQREQQNALLAERALQLQAEQQQLQSRTSELQAEAEQVRQRLLALDSETQSARADLDAIRDRRAELGNTLARLESDLQHLREGSIQELGAAPDELFSALTTECLQGEVLAAEETLCREMRAKLESMGPVNMMALEEYNETASRHQFLDTQRKDLLESIENTQSTIKEIETVSRQKFEQAFVHINENFQLTFTKLFGGGSAFMRLTDEENGAEGGIDIVASPPGKKLQNVLLLSGGEKALTALSLLVGIFQYQPSPFCILDEVDAPLDEANVTRFVDLVKEMSLQTQFILITHSKRTMSAAPVMYGITMQEPGVSKVVSVRFGAESKTA